MNLSSNTPTLMVALSVIAIVCSGCSNDAPTQDQMLSTANDALAAGQYDKAEKAYREVLQAGAQQCRWRCANWGPSTSIKAS